MIRVLVVDDSNYMRNLITTTLSSDASIEVVGTAVNGLDAIEKVKSLAPDVVTMDINMPRMTGIEAVGKIMEEHPVPVLMISAQSKKGARLTLEALKRGAVDFIQ
ncbi:MAG: response regulator, partial [bacterium]|nr:response regulator [bacterium]